jgi:hypothetical protein
LVVKFIGAGVPFALSTDQSVVASSYRYLYPSHLINCGSDAVNKPYGICQVKEEPVTTIVNTVMPTPTATAPITKPSLSGRCDLIWTNQGKPEVFVQARHEKMCSIPIAGKLTSRVVDYSTMPDNVKTVVDKGIADGALTAGQTSFTMCDCECNGYWVDDAMTNDNMKCSKCAVPDCVIC